MSDWIKIKIFDSQNRFRNIWYWFKLNKFFEWHLMPYNALSKTKELGCISIINAIVPPENFKYYLDTIHKKIKMKI